MLRFRLGIRPRTVVLAGLAAIVVLATTAAALLVTLDWRPHIEAYASRALDRRVTIGALRIGWRNPLALELSDVRLANASWGSEPDMLSVETVSAAVDLAALLHGVLRFETLRLEKPRLLLERDAGGVGNWRFAKGGAAAGAFAIVPQNRSQFPTLIAFALRDGGVTYRTTSSDLRIDFHDLAIRSPGDRQRISLELDGAYNGTPTRLTATTDSYTVLHNAAVPFGADFRVTSEAGAIGFTGTMAEPLDFDGVRGKLDIDTRQLGQLLRMLGAELDAAFPFAVSGALERTGTRWHLAEAQGRAAAGAFAGTLSLVEGERGAADALAAGLDFAALDLAPLLGSGRTGKPVSLRLESRPAATIEARIKAKQLSYQSRRLADVVLALRTRPGEIAVGELSFAFAGGRVAASGAAKAAGSGSRIAVSAALTGADAAAAARLLDAEPDQIAGRIEGRLSLEMTGATLSEALKTSSGDAVLAMEGGRVSRDLVERASTDLRTLFRAGEGWMPVSCLLGIAALHDGVATIAPLRLRTPETTLVGFGRIDLAREKVDMTVRTEAGSTSLLALNLPLRVTGDFADLHVAPTLTASQEPAGDDPGHLATPELQLLAERSPCRR